MLSLLTLMADAWNLFPWTDCNAGTMAVARWEGATEVPALLFKPGEVLDPLRWGSLLVCSSTWNKPEKEVQECLFCPSSTERVLASL